MNAVRVAGLVVLASALLAGVSLLHRSSPPSPVPVKLEVDPLLVPAPVPIFPWRPFYPWHPWRPRHHAVEDGRPVEGGKVSPDGADEITIDLPASEKKHNTGGRDGSGLCVFTSIEWAARWQNERRLFNFQQQMRQEPGGGYPEKVDRMIARYAAGVPYLQYEGSDPSILAAALRSGRMPAVTYNGYDCHYRGGVSHMVDLVHLSERWAAISDNNYPKDNQIVWMSPSEFLKRWRGGRSGWTVILLRPPPPPVPHSYNGG
jgi:hypothetical protein